MNLIKKTDPNNVFGTQFTDTGWFLIIFLSLAICAFFERLIYDLGRLFNTSNEMLPYFQDSKTISIHALVIILFLIVSLSINYFLAEKKSKYAIILIPYFVVSCILAVQLAIQTGVYFYNNHTNLQFYLAMGILTFVLTYGMYYIQDNLRRRNNKLPAPTLKTLPIALFVVLIGFVLLTLIFTKKEQVPTFNPEVFPVATTESPLSFTVPIMTPSSGASLSDISQEIDQGLFAKIAWDPNNRQDFPYSYMDGSPSLPINYSQTYSAQQIKNSGEVARVMPNLGGINSFFDINTAMWTVDTEFLYGGSVDILSYCRRWYPETIRAQKYKVEYVKNFDINYQERQMQNSWSWQCVQP